MLTLPFIAIVLLTFVSLVAVPCNLLALPVLRLLTPVRPQLRSPLLLLFIAAPWLLGGGVLISSVVDILFGACSVGETCLWNEDPSQIAQRRVLLVVPLMLALTVVGVRLARQLFASRRAVTALQRTCVPGDTADLRIVPTGIGLAFAARGLVFVSSGLHGALGGAHVAAVLAHERAHLQRSDGVCQIMARLLSCALVPPLRGKMLDALTLANEAACDDAAAIAGGRLTVAAAILAAERLVSGKSVVLSPGFAESFVPERVRRLISPVPAPWRAATAYGAAICGIMSVFLLGDLLYYAGMLLLYPASVVGPG